MRRTETLDNSPVIEGYDFDNGFNFDDFVKSYFNTGFQATEFGKAVEITKQMIDDKATIFLSFTGNAISSGLREIIKYLVKNKMVDVLITTASGVEEDVIKSMNNFKVGDFDVPGRSLYEHGVGRIGNIFVPNDRYLHFERFMNPIFDEFLKLQEDRGVPLTPVEITKILGEKLNEGSYLFWAAKNNIPVFCPGIMDGSFGDLVYFMKQRKPNFLIDVTEEYKRLIRIVLDAEKTGALILGGGIAKHYNLNANIFREGHDYAVYLSTAQEFDGSDSGGNIEEAKTWAKVKLNAPAAKVKADFTITFPLLVASTFVKNVDVKFN
ncbi:deoxyhypusine synthase [Candidatus Woesearchaeota archaeon]|nr:deoxyhypusine synthase [Candidatus Woesearchaeota archaeon]MCF7901716.1 deoxyhypusine synthase [Candidatus Woesearchaeota archaeon]MCF8013850.1 deoxyhypusine synthase [Candidatus Woesearchaeota archaeon]